MCPFGLRSVQLEAQIIYTAFESAVSVGQCVPKKACFSWYVRYIVIPYYFYSLALFILFVNITGLNTWVFEGLSWFTSDTHVSSAQGYPVGFPLLYYLRINERSLSTGMIDTSDFSGQKFPVVRIAEREQQIAAFSSRRQTANGEFYFDVRNTLLLLTSDFFPRVSLEESIPMT